ncbi:FG-GAP repeat domain-containing protein [Methylomagnum ishizawai]|uniref:FG-GAP repeat domain-containing protein n=1 Tax=Methylomagnum ishizawai TaxID=1760988 RepID=UPI001C3398D6|nr:VCBS repeat-containing protein [Methylomagnum ishizawai]BBL73360.1 hypothetical protein MishRS11D_04580 [Methylomagnum ishizawai]
MSIRLSQLFNRSRSGAFLCLLLAGTGWAQAELAFKEITGLTRVGNLYAGQPISADMDGDGKSDLAVASDNGVSVLLGNGDGTFQTPRYYALGYTPASIAASDLNGDGHTDLATMDAEFSWISKSSVSVLLGNGDGTFKTRQDYAVGSFSPTVVASDLNGDGTPDLVIANEDSRSVSVLLGKGDGTFQPRQQYGAGIDFGPDSVAASDLNGDGYTDLATVSDFYSTISVLLGNGDGTFKANRDYVAGYYGSNPHSITLADLNGDGKPDLATMLNPGESTRKSPAVLVMLGNGDGTFLAPQYYAVSPSLWSTNNVGSVMASDLNGDGHPDLVTANPTASTVSVLLGKGDGTFMTHQDYAARSNVSLTFTVSDLNADGHPDLAIANDNDGSVSILQGKGDGSFKELHPKDVYAVGHRPTDVHLSDLNGDAHTDLATTNSLSGTISVHLGTGNGTFRARRDYAVVPYGTSLGSLTMSDLNGDGHLDLAASHGKDVSVVLGKGDGSFTPRQDIAMVNPPYYYGWISLLKVSDINSDGKPDLITMNQDFTYFAKNSVSILLGNGDGTFKANQDYAVGKYPNSIAVSDLNGDGHPDIAVTLYYHPRHRVSVSTLSVLLGNGDGTLKARQDYAACDGPFDIKVSDLNGDGHPDFVLQCSTGLSVLLGNGDGTFKARQDYAACKGPEINVADLNNDGHPDLAATCKKLLVLYGKGDGTFQSHRNYAVKSPRSLKVADLNGDGKPDLASLSGSSSLSVLQSKGDGTFGARKDFDTGHLPCNLAFGDLNGDGKPEAVTANCQSDTVSVLINTSKP